MTSVAILGMGHSLSQYMQEFESAGSKRFTDETWAINSVMYWLSPLLITSGIAMDSMWRDERMDGGKWKKYVANMRGCGLPVITDKADPDWPNLQEYPLKEVIADIWPNAKSEQQLIPDLENTINFALALAIYRKFTEIHLFGCDFRAQDDPYKIAAVKDALENIKPWWFAYHDREIVERRRDREPGEPTAMYLLGIADARGIKTIVCPGSTLGGCDRPRYLYGYQDQPDLFGEHEKQRLAEEKQKEYTKLIRDIYRNEEEPDDKTGA